MTSLYKLTEQTRELQLLAESEDITPEMLEDTFKALDGEFNEKALSITHVIKNMSSDINAIDVEIKRLAERKKILENKENSIKEYLRTNMEACEIKKIECPLFTISLRSGRDVVLIEDASKIPDDFIDVSVVEKPDKRSILKAIKSGENIPGASIDKSKSSLLIK